MLCTFDPQSGNCYRKRFKYRSQYLTSSSSSSFPSDPTHIVSHIVGLYRIFQSINARCRHSASQMCCSYCKAPRELPIVTGDFTRVDCEKGAPQSSGRQTPSSGICIWILPKSKLANRMGGRSIRNAEVETCADSKRNHIQLTTAFPRTARMM